MKAWIKAFRLRTLPLSLSTIAMGSFLAAFNHNFSWQVCLLAMLTTLFLQILSNLANDYGDFVKGTDNEDRIGPERALQSGAISTKEMKNAIIIFIILSLLSGIALLGFSFYNSGILLPLLFLGLGILSIIAAVKYTAGKNAYGYLGLGDIAVFLFFGILGVAGTYFLHAKTFDPMILLPASTLGLFSAGVLNLNNMRDRVPDAEVGKKTLAVKLGFKGAKIYHYFLIIGGFSASIIFLLLNVKSGNLFNWICLLTLPLFILNIAKVYSISEPKQFDPLLKQLALSTTLFVIVFGIGLCLF